MSILKNNTYSVFMHIFSLNASIFCCFISENGVKAVILE